MHTFNAVLLFALPFVVAATPLAVRTDGSSCNTGSLQCCNETTNDSSVLGGLNIIGKASGLIGMQCNPISVIDLSGNSCQQQTLCCTGNSYQGNLIATGCTPINVLH